MCSVVICLKLNIRNMSIVNILKHIIFNKKGRVIKGGYTGEEIRVKVLITKE